MLQVHVKSWGLKIEKNTLFLTNMWENTSKWCFLGVMFSYKTSWDFEHLMSFSTRNLMSFWTAHEFCLLNLMTFTQKPHEFVNSSWVFVFQTSWVLHEKLMSFQRAHDLKLMSFQQPHEFWVPHEVWYMLKSWVLYVEGHELFTLVYVETHELFWEVYDSP